MIYSLCLWFSRPPLFLHPLLFHAPIPIHTPYIPPSINTTPPFLPPISPNPLSFSPFFCFCLFAFVSCLPSPPSSSPLFTHPFSASSPFIFPPPLLDILRSSGHQSLQYRTGNWLHPRYNRMWTTTAGPVQVSTTHIHMHKTRKQTQIHVSLLSCYLPLTQVCRPHQLLHGQRASRQVTWSPDISQEYDHLWGSGNQLINQLNLSYRVYSESVQKLVSIMYTKIGMVVQFNDCS